MNVAEIKKVIIEKVLSIEDKEQLDRFLMLINTTQKTALDTTMQKHLDKILSEDHHVLHRLAQ